MVPSILSIGTAVPETRLSQDAVRDLFASQPEIDRRTQRLIRAAFDASAIDFRHTVLPELGGLPRDGLRVRAESGMLLAPSTGARNDEYRRTAPTLFRDAAAAALSRAQISADKVTHVLTVSCTGFFAPGPDVALVRDLGLDAGVQRAHLGFIGCAAAMPALRLASSIAASDPSAMVLVVAAELCTLHVRCADDPDQIVAASIFADGAAAALVSGDPDYAATGRLELDGFETQLLPEGDDAMQWTIGDAGFEMTLTAQVPRLVGAHARSALPTIVASGIDAWAVHPGGRSILDRVEDALGAPPGALDASRETLRRYGNMSSATVLFVLDALWSRGLEDAAHIGALAFGPGLTVEAARMVHHAASSGVVEAPASADRDRVPVTAAR
ncbi:type III polyketide synthase [Microbacterium koreense]|uniref:Type III polyketide synthase n=1 Tax=Microbacterium koreense TaxID=323761 RepID=A0ABW2ZN56_9MICO